MSNSEELKNASSTKMNIGRTNTACQAQMGTSMTWRFSPWMVLWQPWRVAFHHEWAIILKEAAKRLNFRHPAVRKGVRRGKNCSGKSVSA